MRPHEEEWALAGTEVIPDGNRDRSATFYGPCEPAAARAKLAHAAPDMARALKAFLSDHGHTPDCGYSGYGDHQCSTECAGARAALTKAGVL